MVAGFVGDSLNEFGADADIDKRGSGPKLVTGAIDQAVRQRNLFVEGA